MGGLNSSSKMNLNKLFSKFGLIRISHMVVLNIYPDTPFIYILNRAYRNAFEMTKNVKYCMQSFTSDEVAIIGVKIDNENQYREPYGILTVILLK